MESAAHDSSHGGAMPQEEQQQQQQQQQQQPQQQQQQPQQQRRRAFCSRCFKAAAVCICARFERRVANRVGVTILQHPKEKLHPLGSARIALLGLENVQLIVVPFGKGKNRVQPKTPGSNRSEEGRREKERRARERRGEVVGGEEKEGVTECIGAHEENSGSLPNHGNEIDNGIFKARDNRPEGPGIRSLDNCTPLVGPESSGKQHGARDCHVEPHRVIAKREAQAVLDCSGGGGIRAESYSSELQGGVEGGGGQRRGGRQGETGVGEERGVREERQGLEEHAACEGDEPSGACHVEVNPERRSWQRGGREKQKLDWSLLAGAEAVGVEEQHRSVGTGEAGERWEDGDGQERGGGKEEEEEGKGREREEGEGYDDFDFFGGEGVHGEGGQRVGRGWSILCERDDYGEEGLYPGEALSARQCPTVPSWAQIPPGTCLLYPSKNSVELTADALVAAVNLCAFSPPNVTRADPPSLYSHSSHTPSTLSSPSPSSSSPPSSPSSPSSKASSPLSSSPTRSHAAHVATLPDCQVSFADRQLSDTTCQLSGSDGQISHPIRHLIVIDGTWSKAKRIFKQNPWLMSLPHFHLPPHAVKPSLYGYIRRQPKLDCISTVEALVFALKILEPQTEGLDGLLTVFDSMVADQIRFMRGKAPVKGTEPLLKSGRF